MSSLSIDLENLQINSAEDREQIKSLISELEAANRHAERNRLSKYEPYPKQESFHRAGALHRERLLVAGNQLGKTFAGAAEAAMHATGRYPEWWRGRRFDHPIRGWVGSETSEVTRD